MATRRKGMWGAVARFGGLAALSAGGAVVILGHVQDAFIYVPSRDIARRPDFLGLPFEDLRLTTSDGETIGAWLVPAAGPAATILFLHGNAGNRADRINDLAGFRRAGLSTLILDYRGYGESTGRPTEPGLLLDAMAGWEHLVAVRGIDPARIVVYGESIGSAPALALARKLHAEGRAGPGAIVLEGAFTSALEMGRRHFGFLPVRWILRTRMDNLAAVRELDEPILFLHGERDEVAPIDMARRLHEASASRMKELYVVPGAWHNTLWTTGGVSVPERIAAFLGRALDPPDGAALPTGVLSWRLARGADRACRTSHSSPRGSPPRCGREPPS